MIRKLLTTTALATLLTGGALAQEAPANTTQAPANTTEAPANTTEAPANTTEAPANATETPANTTETPANTMEAPANATDTPANTTEAPANETDAPAETEAGPPAEMVADSTYSATDGDNIASRILGSTVYTSAGDDAETIGDINDLVIGQDGNVAAAVIGVGGFLGIGEKNVAIRFDQLQWSQASDGSWRYVLATTADQLNAAPDFEFEDENEAAAEEQQQEQEQEAAEDQQQQNAAGGEMAVDQGAQTTQMAPADTTQMAPAENTEVAPENAGGGMAATTPLDRTRMTPMDAAAMTAEDLEGTAVYGTNDEQIGEIGDFVLNPQGGIDAVIVDVGGFLGLGQKPVAVAFDNLQFSIDENNNRYLFLNTTQEQLEAQPEFNKDTYAGERDAQRMMTNP